jgi:hypothetical protein
MNPNSKMGLRIGVLGDEVDKAGVAKWLVSLFFRHCGEENRLADSRENRA